MADEDRSLDLYRLVNWPLRFWEVSYISLRDMEVSFHLFYVSFETLIQAAAAVTAKHGSLCGYMLY